jgi:hypothetical protein
MKQFTLHEAKLTMLSSSQNALEDRQTGSQLSQTGDCAQNPCWWSMSDIEI